MTDFPAHFRKVLQVPSRFNYALVTELIEEQ